MKADPPYRTCVRLNPRRGWGNY